MTVSGINLITRLTVLVPVLVWAAWEMALVLWLRPAYGGGVRTISMEARGLAFGILPALAYALTGLCFHWFVTWSHLPWEGAVARTMALTWWLVLGAYLVAGWLDPNRAYWPMWSTWLRYPPVAALLGAVLAFVAFPQRSPWVPWRS